jgi:hypothetical protein
VLSVEAVIWVAVKPMFAIASIMASMVGRLPDAVTRTRSCARSVSMAETPGSPARAATTASGQVTQVAPDLLFIMPAMRRVRCLDKAISRDSEVLRVEAEVRFEHLVPWNSWQAAADSTTIAQNRRKLRFMTTRIQFLAFREMALTAIALVARPNRIAIHLAGNRFSPLAYGNRYRGRYHLGPLTHQFDAEADTIEYDMNPQLSRIVSGLSYKQVLARFHCGTSFG